MKPSKHLMYTGVAVAVAAALGACATERTASPNHDYTYCSRYSNEDPMCGAVQPQVAAAVPAAAPAAAAETTAAAAAAPEAPKEKTVVVAAAGPPPNSPGQCYTKVVLNAEYRDEQVQEMVKPATERVEYSEAVYEEVDEQVVVKPAGKQVTVVPAEYAEVQEQVLVREAYRREIEVPALYNTYYEQVMERPARDVWKPGRGAIEKIDPNTGEILCLVREDALYKTVERKELAREATKRYEDVPAEYAAVTKMVMKNPERVEEIEIPAEYQTIKVRKQVKGPEVVSKVPVEAEYATVTKRVMVNPPHEEWTQVLCDVNATPARIQQVEAALNKQGYAVSENGQIDDELNQAVRSFQEKNGLPPTGLMTAETLALLGVELEGAKQ